MNERSRILSGLAGLASGLSPLNSFTFIVALGVSAVAGFVWYKESGDLRAPFPTYGTVAASYAGGFIVGRLFRTVVRTVAFAVVVVLGGLMLLKFVHVDTTKAKQTVEAGSGWIQEHADRIADDLVHLLPSGGAAGVGVLAGGRRRRSKVG